MNHDAISVQICLSAGLSEQQADALLTRLSGAPDASQQPTSAELCMPDASIEAIQFALENDEGMDFLRCWNEGSFEAIRREWPEAPEAVFIGADPLHPMTKFPLSADGQAQQESIHLPQLRHAIADNTELRQQIELMKDQLGGNVWLWESEGENHLDSMGNRMGVLIYACDLKALLAQAKLDSAMAGDANEALRVIRMLDPKTTTLASAHAIIDHHFNLMEYIGARIGKRIQLASGEDASSADRADAGLLRALLEIASKPPYEISLFEYGGPNECFVKVGKKHFREKNFRAAINAAVQQEGSHD